MEKITKITGQSNKEFRAVVELLKKKNIITDAEITTEKNKLK